MVTVFLVPSHDATPAYWALAAVHLLAGALGGCVNGASGRAVMGWFPPQKRGGVFAIYGTLAGLAVIAGPTVGGLLVTHFGWRTDMSGAAIASSIAVTCEPWRR